MQRSTKPGRSTSYNGWCMSKFAISMIQPCVVARCSRSSHARSAICRVSSSSVVRGDQVHGSSGRLGTEPSSSVFLIALCIATWHFRTSSLSFVRRFQRSYAEIRSLKTVAAFSLASASKAASSSSRLEHLRHRASASHSKRRSTAWDSTTYARRGLQASAKGRGDEDLPSVVRMSSSKSEENEPPIALNVRRAKSESA